MSNEGMSARKAGVKAKRAKGSGSGSGVIAGPAIKHTWGTHNSGFSPASDKPRKSPRGGKS